MRSQELIGLILVAMGTVEELLRILRPLLMVEDGEDLAPEAMDIARLRTRAALIELRRALLQTGISVLDLPDLGAEDSLR